MTFKIGDIQYQTDCVKYYLTDNLDVMETTLYELALEYCEQTTSPVGVMPCIFCEGVNVMTWGYDNKKRIIETYETEDEAQRHVMTTYLYDLDQNCNAPTLFDTREECEAYKKELEQELT